MKALFIVGIVVAFLLSSIWFISSQVKENSQENLKKELVDKDKTDYVKLTEKNKKIREQHKSQTNEEPAEKYTETSIDQLIDEEEIAAIEPLQENNSKEESFKLNKWNLSGSNKNVLILDFTITNITNEPQIERIKVICSTFNEEGDFAGTKSSRYSINLQPGEKIEFKNEVFGTVSKSSINIKCEIEKVEKIKKIKSTTPTTDITKLLED